MRILVTGASGCVGHYISETLIQNTDYELFLCVRNPAKLQVDTNARPGIHVITADMMEIEKQAELLKTIEVAVLTAAGWGGQEAFDINYTKTHALFDLLDPQVCQQVIYFSTQSVLDRQNKLLPEAGKIGTDYIVSKYQCLDKLTRERNASNSAKSIASKITTVFPTLVFGGDATKPYSYLSADLPTISKYAGLLQWFSADGSFHFIHGKDIAEVVRHLITHPEIADKFDRRIVLGNQLVQADAGIKEICAYFGKKSLFQIPLSIGLTNFFIKLFKIQMAEWDRFCLNYRHFSATNPVSPATFGLPTYAPTITDIFRTRGLTSTAK
ncbi:NAD-dependent epimerase/dehydratase family protein [Chamaesiphon minutus]|uniref:NAD dependent epimerase/dehydratase family protein n=1 Tax=Chamaesiphon minutus (strain ATCC 27169 / PCC 6605) TaxID=1173020 RepID=K9UH19_CHAP6|nr:NAD(P)-dependent oxidoreductase [Chamaesiphon minutus]AFY94110.1 NAD dependent epimerase/dehydratase family protein [Chamaesiphon minutus PCC 6605]